MKANKVSKAKFTRLTKGAEAASVPDERNRESCSSQGTKEGTLKPKGRIGVAFSCLFLYCLYYGRSPT